MDKSMSSLTEHYCNVQLYLLE